MEPLPGMSYHTNIAKHGVGFGRGEKSLGDPHVIVREDRVVEGEQRLHAIGYVGRVLLVVQTVREEGLGAIIRIVSARKATPTERKLYEESEQEAGQNGHPDYRADREPQNCKKRNASA
jgi:uncharacterized DUF497 family protein